MYFRVVHRLRMTPGVVRQWARRGHITSHGDRKQRYDLLEITAYLRRRGIIGGDQQHGQQKGPHHGKAGTNRPDRRPGR